MSHLVSLCAALPPSCSPCSTTLDRWKSLRHRRSELLKGLRKQEGCGPILLLINIRPWQLTWLHSLCSLTFKPGSQFAVYVPPFDLFALCSKPSKASIAFLFCPSCTQAEVLNSISERHCWQGTGLLRCICTRHTKCKLITQMLVLLDEMVRGDRETEKVWCLSFEKCNLSCFGIAQIPRFHSSWGR